MLIRRNWSRSALINGDAAGIIPDNNSEQVAWSTALCHARRNCCYNCTDRAVASTTTPHCVLLLHTGAAPIELAGNMHHEVRQRT